MSAPPSDSLLSDLVRSGKADDLAMALRLVWAATELALSAGADKRKVFYIRGLADRLGRNQ